MNLGQYVKNEIEERKHDLNESIVQLGKTDDFKGNDFIGPHYHEYILWDPNTGWGKTGDALDVPTLGAKNVPTHEHMIVNGVVLEAAGHTHKLEKPNTTCLSTDVPKQAIVTTSGTAGK